MKLEKFKERDKKRVGIVVFTVCCILLVAGVFFYKTFALFETKKDFNIIEGTVQPLGDLYFAFYIDGVISENMPTKGGGYVFDATKSTCNNGARPEFNGEEWSVKVFNLTTSRTKCILHFKKYVPPAIDYITNLAKTDTINLSYDNTVDNNLRYIGANPNNYVRFNNELWRIIGVMNNVDDGNGNKASRLKIIRNEVKESVWNIINDWSQAKAQINLNTIYYESIINKEMIDTVQWNIGGIDSNFNTANEALTSQWYGYERGTHVYTGRPTIWNGKIGLMYPSDYGYATSGGNTSNRVTCLAKELWNWDSLTDCYNNSWLYNSTFDQWTLTPDSLGYTNSGDCVFYILNTGKLTSGSGIRPSSYLSPVLYLKSAVQINGGTGTSVDPYELLLD